MPRDSRGLGPIRTELNGREVVAFIDPAGGLRTRFRISADDLATFMGGAGGGGGGGSAAQLQVTNGQVLTVEDLDNTLTNFGAVAPVTATLPPATVEMLVFITKLVDQPFYFLPASGQRFRGTAIGQHLEIVKGTVVLEVFQDGTLDVVSQSHDDGWRFQDEDQIRTTLQGGELISGVDAVDGTPSRFRITVDNIAEFIGGGGVSAQLQVLDGDVLTVEDLDNTLTNFGAVASVTATLPPATVGMLVFISKLVDQKFRFLPSSGQTIRNGAVNGFIELTTLGTTVLECLVAGTWDVVSDTTSGWRLENGYQSEDKRNNYYNIVSYGADPTGVADSTAAVNAAHAAAAAATFKGIVIVPIGTYKLASTATLQAAMHGQGGNGYASSMARAVFVPTITNGTAALRGMNLHGYDLRNFAIEPAVGTPNPNPSGGNVQNCIGLQLGKSPALISTSTVITKANPCVVTTKYLHGYETGDYIAIYNVSGMSEINIYAYTTIATANISAGATTLVGAWNTGFVIGQYITINLNDGSDHYATITNIAGTTFTFSPAVPSAANIGKAVGHVGYRVTRINATSFSIPINSTPFSTHTAGGLIYPLGLGAAHGSGNPTTACTRGVLEDVTITNCALNFDITGWLSKQIGLKSFNATLGFAGGYLNTNLLDLVTENCWQGMQLLGCNQLNVLRFEDEGVDYTATGGSAYGGAANSIDYCQDIDIQMIGTEGVRKPSSPTPWLEIGKVSYNANINVLGGIIAAANGTHAVTVNNTDGFILPPSITGTISVSSSAIPMSAKRTGVYNVKDFGALGNGTTDDSTAINTANVAAQANKGSVSYPGFTYGLASTVTILAPMVCAGGSTPNQTNTGGQQNNSYSAMFKNIGINDNTTTYNGDASTKTFSVGFNFWRSSDLTVLVGGVEVDPGGSYVAAGGETGVYLSYPFTVGSGQLTVWKNGTILTVTTDYVEYGNGYINFVVVLAANDLIAFAVGNQYIVTGGGTYTYGQTPTLASGSVIFRQAPATGTGNVVIKRVNPMLLLDTVQWGYGFTKFGGFAVDGNYSAGVRNCIGFLARGAVGISALQNYEVFDIYAKNCHVGLDLLGYGGLLRNIQTWKNQKIGCLLKLANAVTVEGGWFDAGVKGAWGMRIQGGNSGDAGKFETGGIVVAGSGATVVKLVGPVFQSSDTGGGRYDANGLDISEQINAVDLDSVYFEGLDGDTVTTGTTLLNPVGATYVLRVGAIDHLGRAPSNADGRREQRAVVGLTIKNTLLNGYGSNVTGWLGGNVLFANVQRLKYDNVSVGVCRIQYGELCSQVSGALSGTTLSYAGGDYSRSQGTACTLADFTGTIGQPARSFIPNPTNAGAASGTVRGFKTSNLHAGITLANETSIIRNGAQSIKVTQAASLSFTVNTTTNALTTSAAHGWAPGAWVILLPSSGGTLPAPLVAGTTYYTTTGTTGSTVYLSTTGGGAGAVIDITTAGTGTFYIGRTDLPRGWYPVPYGQEILGAVVNRPVVFTGFMYVPSSNARYASKLMCPAVGVYVNGNIYQQALGYPIVEATYPLDAWFPFAVWNRVTANSGGYYGMYVSPVYETAIAGANPASVYVTDLAFCPNPQDIVGISGGNFSMAAESGMMIGQQLIVSAPAKPVDASVSWRVGDIVYNNAPVAGGSAAWICVVNGAGGTANQWKEMGAIEA